MNSLKSLFILGVLAAAACGVYVSLNHNQDSSSPPGTPQNDADKPAPSKIQMPAASGGNTPLGNAFAGPAHPSASGGLPGAPATPAAAPGSFPPGYPTAGSRSANAATVPGQSLFPPVSALGPGSVATASTAVAIAPGTTSAIPPPPPGPPPSAGDSAAGRSSHLDLPSDVVARNDALPPPPRNPATGSLGGSAAAAADANSFAELDALMKSAEAKVNAGQLAEAHLQLTSVYGKPWVPPERARQITQMLDQLAATVIYSRQHLLEPAYRVQPGDTLERIAERYNVPSPLLAKINGIRDPQNLAPGRELKVIRGPFSASVDLGKHELTLLVQGRYAGRFAIDSYVDSVTLARLPGTYMVRNKGDRSRPDPSAPRSPAGGASLFLDLGELAIETAPARVQIVPPPALPIVMASREMGDVYDMLSVGSRVVIQR
jgi:LysM repeat protein